MTYRRDDGTEIEVEYEIEQRGSAAVIGLPWESEPAEPTIVALTEAWEKESGKDIELTQAEIDRIEQQIGEQLDSEPVDDYWPDE